MSQTKTHSYSKNKKHDTERIQTKHMIATKTQTKTT